MNSSEVDESLNPLILTDYAPHFAEVLRIAPFFHNSAEPWSQLIDKREMVYQFICRIRDDGTICGKRWEIDAC